MDESEGQRGVLRVCEKKEKKKRKVDKVKRSDKGE